MDTRPHGSIYTLPGDAPGRGDTTRRTAEVIPLPASVERIGGYRIGRLLGRGGMGVVYLAESEALGRKVALKVLTGADDPEAVERFLIEARAAARLRHPNVVGVHEVGRDGSRWFLAMDLVDGESLRARILREGPLPPREAARIVEVVGGALHHAHTSGLLHRDVKPHNVLLANDGTPLLADFGLAKDVSAAGITVSGAVLGTPAYMSPEQAQGDRARLDRRTDVYALGATLYEALTGKPPFEGATALNIMRQVIEDAPVPPSRRRPGLDADLETIVLKALEKEPAARYDTAVELAEDLRRWAAHEPIAARRIGLGGRLARWARRRPVTAAATAALALVTLSGGSAACAVAWDRRTKVRKAEAATRAAMAQVSSAPSPTARAAAIRGVLGAARVWFDRARDPATAAEVAALGLRLGDEARGLGDVSLANEAYTLARDHATGEERATLDASVKACEAMQAAAMHTAMFERAAARRALVEAVRLRPGWIEPLLLRADLYVKHDDDVAAALQDLDAALALAPDVPETLMARADLRRRAGDLEGAIRDQRRAALLRPKSAFVAEDLSRLLLLKGDLAEAAACLEGVIGNDPDAAPALVQRAECRLAAGDDEGAEADLRRAVALMPDLRRARHALGQLQTQRGQLAAALETLDGAVALAPSDAVALGLRGRVHAHRGDADAALRDFEAATRHAPHLPDPWLELAQLRLAREDADGALRDATRALGLRPSASGFALRAGVHLYAGREAAAISDANVAIALEPRLAGPYVVRGMALAVSPAPADRARARDDLRRYLELAPDAPNAEHVRRRLADLR